MRFIVTTIFFYSLNYFALENNNLIQQIDQFLNEANFNQNLLEKIQQGGQMQGLYTSKETIDIFEYLCNKYQSYVFKEEIGSTFEGRQLNSYILQKNIEENSLQYILYTSAHHSRELVTVNFIVSIFVQFLWYLLKEEYGNVFTWIGVAFIPIVNLDSHTLISESYNTKDFFQFKNKRKNMNSNYCQKSIISSGVDLNRNYDFHYGENVEDSNPCGETYRGPASFSEKETQAVKNLIEGEYNFVSAMNFHAYGNMWIRPYNYSRNSLLKKSPEIKANLQKFYSDFETVVKTITPSAHYGNAISMVNYLSFGEASDWMLGKHDIVSFSPEVGTEDINTEKFIPEKTYVNKILNLNYKIVY